MTVPQARWWMLFVEPSQRWMAGLRVELLAADRLGAARRLRSVTALPNPAALAIAAAPVVIALELSPDNIAERLAEIARLRLLRAVAPVGLLAEGWASLKEERVATLAALECGAGDVAASFPDVGRLAGLADRHAMRLASRDTPQSHESEVRSRLPWQSPPWAIG